MTCRSVVGTKSGILVRLVVIIRFKNYFEKSGCPDLAALDESKFSLKFFKNFRKNEEKISYDMARREFRRFVYFMFLALSVIVKFKIQKVSKSYGP